ncbi:MAG: hypothetical protein WBL63_17210 [Candidatus Acidiferrum sp.]
MDTQAPLQKSIFKSHHLYSAIVIVLAVAYVVFVFVSRSKSNQRIAEKAAEQRGADDRAALEQLGGSKLAIRALYVSPDVIHRGESMQLCYDVANAKTVTLDPPEGQVWPSHFRCLDLSPQKTTTYTLTIADTSGKSLSQSVQMQVR